MIARRSRSTLLGALLALLAVFAMNGVSGWHGATFHDDDPAHVESVEHTHGGAQTDPDSPVHLAAHTAGQWLVEPARTLAPVLLSTSRTPVSIVDAALLVGVGPSTLLRPPRA
ncbi:hypothetical protein [Sphingomonas corticis]|uniref:Uncharacterized protein n=1 Tax=Sphingomonas corticis TaxID=2722791 RepID=A0ABX1CRW7_9SPHN|nr:hypothetical protein [Sphingomonas corticis]NJR78755.1 hypothetical protein [Sphingomonas corticis]